MSYHEGSNWQAKKEDEGKPLYGPPKPIEKNIKDFYNYLQNDRLFFVDEVRGWLKQIDRDEISFSKFVELFNEKVFNRYHSSASPVKLDEVSSGGDVELLQRKLEFYREQTDKVRNLVFSSPDIGEPCQNIFEAIVDKLNSQQEEIKRLSGQSYPRWVKASVAPHNFGMYVCKVKIIDDDGLTYYPVTYVQFDNTKNEWTNPRLCGKPCEVIEYLLESPSTNTERMFTKDEVFKVWDNGFYCHPELNKDEYNSFHDS